MPRAGPPLLASILQFLPRDGFAYVPCIPFAHPTLLVRLTQRIREFATSRQLTCQVLWRPRTCGCNSLGAIGRQHRRRRWNAALHCARNSARRGSKRVQRHLAAGRHTLRNGYRPWSLARPDGLRADFGNSSRAAPCASCMASCWSSSNRDRALPGAGRPPLSARQRSAQRARSC